MVYQHTIYLKCITKQDTKLIWWDLPLQPIHYTTIPLCCQLFFMKYSAYFLRKILDYFLQTMVLGRPQYK
jgi:hypothetical protein